jgi:hypothetical protein
VVGSYRRAAELGTGEAQLIDEQVGHGMFSISL